MIKNSILLFFLYSLIYTNSMNILYHLNQDLNWEIVQNENSNQKIYEYNNKSLKGKYIKIEEEVEFDRDDIFNVIRNISKYNQIISNKSLNSELVTIENDTIYAYQLITNSIPFTRDRQYVFKMYQHKVDELVWYIVDENNIMLKPYFDESKHTLTLGAGSWTIDEVDDKDILI